MTTATLAIAALVWGILATVYAIAEHKIVKLKDLVIQSQRARLSGDNDPEYCAYRKNAWRHEMAAMDYIGFLKAVRNDRGKHGREPTQNDPA